MEIHVGVFGVEGGDCLSVIMMVDSAITVVS